MRTEIWRVGRGRAWRVSVAETRRERARGLRGRPGLAPDEALFLARCRSVHTFGMRSAIDVALLARDLRVLRVIRMRPGRLLLPRSRVRHVLELPVGSGVQVGDQPKIARASRLTT